MTKRFSETIVVTTLIFLCMAFPLLAQAQQANDVRDGVLVHISHGSESPHHLLMALKMAVTMAEGGKDVLVYCDIEAVKVLTASGKPVTFDIFPSSHELLNRLKELKVQVLACPSCMKVAKIESKDLREGVSVAQKDLLFSFTKGRILSLDY